MTATASTPKHFYDLLCEQADDPTQVIEFFKNIPTDQWFECVSYRDQEGRTPLFVAGRN